MEKTVQHEITKISPCLHCLSRRAVCHRRLDYFYCGDILNIDLNTWRKGPKLPSVMHAVQSVVTEGSVKVMGSDGKVFQLAEGGNDWIKVADIESYYSYYAVSAAPVVTSQILKC